MKLTMYFKKGFEAKLKMIFDQVPTAKGQINYRSQCLIYSFDPRHLEIMLQKITFIMPGLLQFKVER